MPINVAWDNNEKNIMRYDIGGKWTWREFEVIYATAATMLESVPHTVNFICVFLDDAHLRGYMPPNTLSHLVSIHRDAIPNAGLTVVVNPSKFMFSLYYVLQRLYPRIAERYLPAQSLEEARTLIRKHSQHAPTKND